MGLASPRSTHFLLLDGVLGRRWSVLVLCAMHNSQWLLLAIVQLVCIVGAAARTQLAHMLAVGFPSTDSKWEQLHSRALACVRAPVRDCMHELAERVQHAYTPQCRDIFGVFCYNA